MTEVLFRVMDTEATALTLPEAEVLEAGVTDLFWNPETRASRILPPQEFMFRPTRPISAENRSIHHIQDHEVETAPVCTPAHLKGVVNISGTPYAVAFHNAQYDRMFFTDEVLGEGVWVIDTLKCALRVFDDAPGHKNQILRYHLGLELDDALAMPPHRAGPDSYVTAHILAKMLQTERVADLVGWTKAPRYYATCPLTKHKGAKWCDVPHDFLNWMANKPNDLDEDLKAAAREEINQRRSR